MNKINIVVSEPIANEKTMLWWQKNTQILSTALHRSCGQCILFHGLVELNTGARMTVINWNDDNGKKTRKKHAFVWFHVENQCQTISNQHFHETKKLIFVDIVKLNRQKKNGDARHKDNADLIICMSNILICGWRLAKCGWFSVAHNMRIRTNWKCT